jgi:hypothetical protein
MHNLARKLLRKARQEPSGPVLELQSRFPKKSVLRIPANYVINMGARIPRTPPRTIAGTRRTVKANFCAAKKAGKKPNPAKQLFAQLSKKLDKLSETMKMASLKSKKCHRDNIDSDSKLEIGPGSTRKLGLNLGETVKGSNFTPPGPIKATPTNIASNQDDIRPASFSNADDLTLTSSSQSKDEHDNYSTSTTSNPPEGKTMVVIAVMRGNPKDGYTRQCSNKHCKQRLMQILLDSGSDGDLIFVSKDKPMLLPYSKRLVPQLWKTLNGIFQTKRKAWVELNFFEYSDSKRF